MNFKLLKVQRRELHAFESPLDEWYDGKTDLVVALGEDVVVGAWRSLELEGAAGKPGEDGISLSAGVTVAVAIACNHSHHYLRGNSSSFQGRVANIQCT